MIDLLASPFTAAFDAFCDGVRERCIICSPYITQSQVQRLVQSAERNGVCKHLQCEVITDLDHRALLNVGSDLNALLWWQQAMPQTKFTHLPKVHAKVLWRDGCEAIIGSANFTYGGASRNFEYGVRLHDTAQLQQVERDLGSYALLGNQITLSYLERLRDLLPPLKTALSEAKEQERTVMREANAKIKALQREWEDDLLRACVSQRSVHATFEFTILHVLRSGPQTTELLHEQIRQLQPDFCDDSFDRVIDGQHFGKLWKHQVRTAQQSLKRKGQIEYEEATRLWKLL